MAADSDPDRLRRKRSVFLTPSRWILTALSFAAALAVSVYVIASGWPEEGAPLGLPLWTHGVAIAVVAIEILCRVLKIQFSARAIGTEIAFGTSTRTILAGDFAASLTPSRAGAEPARFLVLTEAGHALPNIVLVLFLELFLEMLSLVVVAALCVAFLDSSFGVATTLAWVVGAYALFILALSAAGVAISRRNASGPPPEWVRSLGVNAFIWRRVQRGLRQLRAGVAGLRRTHRGWMFAALVTSVLHVLARLAVLPLMVYAYGAEIPLAPLVVWPLVLLYGSAIAPAPAGGGVVEFTFRVALVGTISPRLMGAALIWWRVYTFYVYLILGAVSAGRTVMRVLARGSDAEEPRDEGDG